MWRVVVRKEGINKRFEDRESADEFYKECSKKYEKILYKDTSIKKPRGTGEPGQYWCPICGEWRDFISMKGLKNVDICDWCGISSNFYYFKIYNGVLKRR